jgi:branched-chain amino acid transport system permease protein
MSAALDRVRDIDQRVPVAAAILFAVLLPFFFDGGSPFIDDAILALAYVVMALGLNVIVGFAGLLDLGYVAFFAIGAYTMGWLGSTFFSSANDGDGVHVLVTGTAASLPGIHINFVLVLVAAVIMTTIAGIIIGLPTLRLRGDYIAIVTLAFGEIIGQVAANGDQLKIGPIWDRTVGWLPLVPTLGDEATLTRGKAGISPVDKIDLPFTEPFTSLALRPWYFAALVLVLLVLFVNIRLRDSRLGRAWVALREDEVAAISMGIPTVKTKLMAYGAGAAFGGIAGAFLGSYLNTVNASQFEFTFSIFILAMVILGGLGSVWGVVIGAILLSYVNNWLIPDVLNGLPGQLGLDFDLTQVSFAIFGFILVIVMVLRPEGLIPEKTRKQEMHGVGTGETAGAGSDVELELGDVK